MDSYFLSVPVKAGGDAIIVPLAYSWNLTEARDEADEYARNLFVRAGWGDADTAYATLFALGEYTSVLTHSEAFPISGPEAV